MRWAARGTGTISPAGGLPFPCGKVWGGSYGCAPQRNAAYRAPRSRPPCKPIGSTRECTRPPAELAPQVSLDGEYTLQGDDPGSLAYTFTYGGAAFFVLDLRTWRVHAPSGSTLLGGAQWKILEDWLLAVKDLYPVKFLISSSAFLMDRWLDFSLERWSAFPQERARLLSFLAANDIEGVYILTGGLRAAYAVRLDLYGPQGKDLQVWEFASSPLEHKRGSQVGALGNPLRSGLAKRSTLRL